MGMRVDGSVMGMKVDGSVIWEEEGVEEEYEEVERLLKRAGILKIRGGLSSVEALSLIGEGMFGESGSIGGNRFSVPRMISDCSFVIGIVAEVCGDDHIEPVLIG